MQSNSLFDTLNSSGSLGVGERSNAQKKKTSNPVLSTLSNSVSEQAHCHFAHQSALSDVSASPGTQANNIYVSNKTRSSVSPSSVQKSYANSNNILIGIVMLCSIVGMVGVGGLIASNVDSSSSPDIANAVSYTRNIGTESIPYGKARFKSGRTGKAELIGVQLSSRTNSNGDKVYDASWVDGYKSTYVFWASGRAEIFSKNGNGNIERTNARFRKMSNGDCVITANTNAVTTFPRFTPVTN